METYNPRDDPQPTSDPDSPDRTLSTGASGGVAAGQIGPYRLLQLIGEGGMGEVWLAAQKTPIYRTVALKLIKAGMDTKAVVARFESERQALALMDHPNIARVFDAGSTAEGKPFFVMEYVPGLPITEYCDKHRLTVNERLELLMQVCGGVQHAHQKAIIHRDLKPSNVLVVEQDGKPVPKIIDFGLAKATAQRLTDKTMFTELGMMVGTPEYMSPEQLDQREQNIDTRTDVYSLGVILYQLLVGVLPFDAKGLRAAGLEAILRVVREQDPVKPSTKIRSMGNASNASAEKRKENPSSFARRMQGELDWITMKALEKDRSRRYGSAAELAADIQRHLHDEPVIAHPPSTAYRARKYVRRHRLGVGIAAAGVLLLVAFAIAQAVQIRRITRERDRADRITDFMTKMFKVARPSEARGNSVTAREILDKASKEIKTGLISDPELQAKMMYTMAGTYRNLGLHHQSQDLYASALEIQRRVLGPRNRDTMRSMYGLASSLGNQSHDLEADKQYREALELQRQVLGPEHRDTLDTLSNLAIGLMGEGKFAESDKMEREALEAQSRVLGREDPDTVRSMGFLASILMSENRWAESVKLEREAVEIQRRKLGPEDPETLSSISILSAALKGAGEYAEAEKLQRETIEIQRRILGPEHPDTLGSMANLANILEAESHFAEAEKVYRETFEAQRRIRGLEHTDTLVTMTNLANVLMDEKHWAEAEKLSRDTYEIERRVFGSEHPYTLVSLENVAIDLSHEGRYADGARLFREAIQTASKVKELGVLSSAWYYFGCMAASSGRRDEAFDYLRQAIDHGYSDAAGMEAEKDLQSLHDDSRFTALVAKARQPVAPVQN